MVGVTNYDELPKLENAAGDAELIAGHLTSIGFDVSLQRDVSLESLELPSLPEMPPGDDAILVVYFSGHGIQVLGENFLLLRDAEASDGSIRGALPLATILQRYSLPGTTVIVVLDSCRDNPFGTTSATASTFLENFPEAYAHYSGEAAEDDQLARTVGGSGLSRVDEQPGNVILAYATRAGAVSYDGPTGSHSPFAQAFASHVGTPDQDFTSVFREVRDDVYVATSGLQEPFLYGSLGRRDILLNEVEGTSPEALDTARIAVESCMAAAAPPTETYPQGRPVSAIVPDTAIPLCEAALDVAADNPNLYFWLGRAYASARDDEKARDGYMVAAQSGIGGAMHNLAILYDGDRALPFQPDRAFYWYNKAMERGVVLSRAHVAWYYETGRAGEQSFAKAFELYKASAEWGETYSQRKTGYFYDLGLGVDRSRSEALYWYGRASADGDANAMLAMGKLLIAEPKSDADITSGAGWIVMAWADGEPDAQNIIGSAESNDRLRQGLARFLGLAPSATSGEVLATIDAVRYSSALGKKRAELMRELVR